MLPSKTVALALRHMLLLRNFLKTSMVCVCMNREKSIHTNPQQMATDTHKPLDRREEKHIGSPHQADAIGKYVHGIEEEEEEASFD